MTAEQAAELILKAAGTSLKHYTLNGSRARIIEAVELVRQDALTIAAIPFLRNE